MTSLVLQPALILTIRKYKLETTLPDSTMQLLGQDTPGPPPEVFSNVTNVIIGSNQVVLDHLAKEASEVVN